VPFPQQPVVQLRDASNIAVAQAGVVVTATIESGGGTLGGTRTATTNASGVATFTNLSITTEKQEHHTIAFTSGSLTKVTSGTILVTYPWTWNLNCEGGTPGSKVPHTKEWENFSKTVYSNAQAATGSQSCQMGITGKSDGWGEWGGILTFPSPVAAGGEVWVRLSMFVPSNFNWVSPNGGMPGKFMRVHTATAKGANVGYHDLFIADPAVTNTLAPDAYGSPGPPVLTRIYEGVQLWSWVGTQAKNAMVRDHWETYEVYIKFDPVSKNAGGGGEVRIWKNNQLLLDRTSEKTLVNATDIADAFYLFTFWNGGAPATQSLYVDDITVTTQTPSNRDAAGNPFIGGPNPQ
jgi:hypothetical protein